MTKRATNLIILVTIMAAVGGAYLIASQPLRPIVPSTNLEAHLVTSTAPLSDPQPVEIAGNSSSSQIHPEWFILRNTRNGFQLRYPSPMDLIDLGGGEAHIAPNTWVSVRVLPTSYDWTDGQNCPDNTDPANDSSASATRMSVGGTVFCFSHMSDGAAGSTYEKYTYVARASKGFVAIDMIFKHLTDVRIMAGCEQDGDLQKPSCKKLQWNEARDTAIFREILTTYQKTPIGS